MALLFAVLLSLVVGTRVLIWPVGDRVWMRTLYTLAIAPFLVFAAGGCGSSSGPPKLIAGSPTFQVAGSSFEPHPFALSPDNVGGIINPGNASLAALHKAKSTVAAVSGSTAPTINHWFYLVNGEGIPATRTAFTPNVLTVNGPAPKGAPSPNGGDTVGVVPLNPNSTSAQLWKAVSSPTSGYAFLRSAESFQTNNGQTFPSMLVGYGATEAALDLGYVSADAAVYWNQVDSPTGDQSGFQKWAYDQSTAQLTNLSDNGQLSNSSSSTAVGTGSTAPASQWYAYPSYYLEQVVGQPNSAPPFPATQSAGETAAYGYLSSRFLPGVYTAHTPAPNCVYGGTPYSGIRCEYVVLTATETIATCAATSLAWSGDPSGTNPGSYDGTTISDGDFATVSTQIALECQYAADVQTTFNYYTQILTSIFVSSGDSIAQLALDLGVSQTQSLNNTVPTHILDGIIYTALSATGSTGVGALANLMEMGVSTADAASAANSSTPLTSPLVTTVGTLYADLTTSFAVLSEQNNNGETAILSDWGRLQAVGPMTELTGYNGLGLNAKEVATIEAQALQGYKLAVMQQLMPVSSYVLGSFVSVTSLPINGIPTWNQFSYNTFGAEVGGPNSNSSYEYEGPNNLSEYPSQTVMQQDIAGNRANLFDFFNGINAWASLPMGPIQNLSCQGIIATLFNATPNDLSVTIFPTDGFIAGPGKDFNAGALGNEGFTDNQTFELRPYGYLPIIVAQNNKGLSMLGNIVDPTFSTETPVIQFTFGTEDSCKENSIIAYNLGVNDGYGFSPSDFQYKYSDTLQGIPQGMWVTIIKN